MLVSVEFPPKKQPLQQSKGGAEGAESRSLVIFNFSGRNSADSIRILQESLKNSDEPIYVPI